MTRTGVLVAALVAGAAVAQTRRPEPEPGAPVVTRLPSHLVDPALVDELMLSPDQVKALAPAGPGKGSPSPAGGQAAAERAKEVLTPDQYRRAVQLMAQDALRTGRGGVVTPAALVAIPAATFRRYPELADAANLNREQRRRAAAAPAATTGPRFGGPQPAENNQGGLPGTPHVVLEPEQTAALAAFVGPLHTTPFAAAVGVRPGGPAGGTPVAPGGPGGFVQPSQRVFLAINNRRELKLTDEQVNALQGLLNAGRVVRSDGDGPPMPPPPADPAAGLAKTLNATQMSRLAQLELWQQVPRGGDDTAKFAVPRVATAVALTADQKAGLAALGKAHRDRAVKAVETADSAATLKAALAAARAEVTEGVAELLTAEQGAKLRDLFGAESRGGGPDGMQNDIFRRIRAAGFGHYQFEIIVVNRFAGVAEDLKLTEEQRATLTTAEAAFNLEFRQGGVNYDSPEAELAKQMGVRSKAMGKIFDDTFTADQKARFRELCIQLRQQLNANQAGGGTYPATGAPGVADALKLTAEQRKRIIDTGEEDEVLTPAQRAGLKRLAGPPLSGGFNFGGPARGRPALPSPRVALLHAGAAHADLGLAPTQAHLIAGVIEAHAAELRPTVSGRSAEPAGYVEPPPEVVEEAVRACEKACDSVLTPAQRDRLTQLTRQAAAHASLAAAFARPEVAGKLGLTPEQQAALEDITADYRTRVGAVGGLPSSAGWPELRERALAGMRETARDRMMGVLTGRQAAAWRELTGVASPAVLAAAPPGAPGRDP